MAATGDLAFFLEEPSRWPLLASFVARRAQVSIGTFIQLLIESMSQISDGGKIEGLSCGS